LKATSNDPVAQLQEVFQIIIHLAAERGKLKVTPNELSEEESENYEKLLRQLEAEVRNHVGVTLPNIKKLYNISKFRVDPTTVNSLR
jgi:16S rRNA G527 N7-methylase RsmG